MAKPYTHSNTSPYRRLQRILAHGIQEVANARSSCKPLFDEVGKTFYLLPTGDIIGFRQWHQQGRPDYVVAGSKPGCVTARDNQVQLSF